MKKICLKKRKAQIQKLPRQLFLYSHVLQLPHNYSIEPSQQFIIHNNYKVSQLKIANQYASIQWKNGVDLSHMNYYCLADILDFGPNYVEVYRNNNWTPQQGQQLNKECIVTFYNGHQLLSQKRNPGNFLRKLKKYCNKRGLELLIFDYVTGEWKVKIFHFTKYEFLISQQDDRNNISKNKKNNLSISEIDQKQQLEAETRAFDPQQQQIPPLTQVFTKSIKVNQNLLKKINEQNFSIHPHHYDIEFQNLAFRGNGYIFKFLRNIHTYKITAVQSRLQTQSELCQIITFIYQNEMLQIQNLKDQLLNKLPNPYKRTMKLINILFSENIAQPLSYQNQQKLKIWLQDLMQETQIRSQNNVVKFLAQRKILQLQNYYISKDKLRDAEITALLEDQIFRYRYQFNYKLQIQLQHILTQNNCMFRNQNWLVNLAIVMWYFMNDSFDERLCSFFLNADNINQKSLIYQHYWEIFKIYTAQRKQHNDWNSLIYQKQEQSVKESTIEQKITNNQKMNESILLDWIVSNHLESFQETFYQQKKYTKIKINIVRNLLSKISNPHIKLLIVKCDHTLNNQQKKILMKQIATREPQKFQLLSNRHRLEKDILMHFEYGKGINYLYNYKNKQAFGCLNKVKFRQQCDSNKLIESELIKVISNSTNIKEIQYLDGKISAGTSYEFLKSYQIYFKLYLNKILIDYQILQNIIRNLKNHQYFKNIIGPFLIQKVLKHEREFRPYFIDNTKNQIIDILFKFKKDSKIQSRLKLLRLQL